MRKAENMSFSGDVRTQIAGIIPGPAHCRLAELAVLLALSASFTWTPDTGLRLEISADKGAAGRKCFTLLRKQININSRLRSMVQDQSDSFQCSIQGADAQEELEKLAAVLGYEDRTRPFGQEGTRIPGALLERECCRRAFLRAAFLCVGSMSDPEKEYHLEFACTEGDTAEQIREVLNGYGMGAKVIRRKKYHVVYLKDSEEIAQVLGLIGAHVSLMELENRRIMKEVRNSVNRRVNCETANISKTVNAAQNQIRDIQFLEREGRLRELPEGLRKIAELRLEHPEVSMSELGRMCSPPISKSGVSHRLRKLSEHAQRLQGGY